jgi:hypothetical protein
MAKDPPVDYDKMIADLVHEVDAKMEDIRSTVRSISDIIKTRQGLEQDKASETEEKPDGTK